MQWKFLLFFLNLKKKFGNSRSTLIGNFRVGKGFLTLMGTLAVQLLDLDYRLLLRRKQELKKGIEFSAPEQYCLLLESVSRGRFPGKVSQVKCHQWWWWAECTIRNKSCIKTPDVMNWNGCIHDRPQKSAIVKYNLSTDAQLSMKSSQFTC